MLSMTGYGLASAPFGGGTLVVEARALNHRFLELRTRFPPSLIDHAGCVDEIARKVLGRGRIEFTARFEGAPPGHVALDRQRAKSAMQALRELRDELGLAEPVPLALLAAVPGLFVEATDDPKDTRAAVEQAVSGACRELVRMRRAEGTALAADLTARVGQIRALCDELSTRAGEIADRYRDRLRRRIGTLLTGTGVTLDGGRLEQEVAVLAERSEVSEELTRLRSHCQQFEGLLTQGDEPVGRKLEFLLQEMGREVNTIGSKVDDLDLTGHVLSCKAELERLREQVQNVL